MMSRVNCCAVLDVGKTNVKLHIIDANYQMLYCANLTNKVLTSEPYPHVDVTGIWKWFIKHLRKAASQYVISAINVSAHGATIACVNDNNLVVPIIDYEWGGVEVSSQAYNAIRPSFDETFSPKLPHGLNVGLQLFWIEECFSEVFYSITTILMYPQFWVWRMTGIGVSEYTSFGSHTDLWNVKQLDFSSLVQKRNWRDRFPPFCGAKDPVAYVSQAFAEQTGISKNCVVYPGLHDSNSSFFRYMDSEGNVDKTIISTGTWVVLFSPSTPMSSIDESKDMLANIDINAKPVPCARFMGGREYSVICDLLNSPVNQTTEKTDIQKLISQQVMVLPSFGEGSGPFGRVYGKIVGEASHGAALATLYCALMTKYVLTLLENTEDIVIEGVFSKNKWFCSLLAQLVFPAVVWLSTEETGAVTGAARLCMKDSNKLCKPILLEQCEIVEIIGLRDYYSQWVHCSTKRVGNAKA